MFNEKTIEKMALENYSKNLNLKTIRKITNSLFFSARPHLIHKVLFSATPSNMFTNFFPVVPSCQKHCSKS